MFGIGAGKIELKIQKTTFNPGEEITGTLFLTVKNPIKARGLFIKIFAEQNVREMHEIQGKMKPTDTTRKLYEFQAELDKEREYPKTNEPVAYPFTLAVPQNAPSAHVPKKPDETIDLLVGALSFVTGTGALGPVKWYLEGYLDLPMAFDVSAKVQLDI